MTMIRFALAVALLAAAPVLRADYKTMDYGPFLDATFQTNKADRLAYRGTAVGFDVPAGKTIMNANGGYIFDTELLRPAAWWTGGFLKLDGVVFSGGHGPNPSPVGNILLTTKPTPGWAKDGDWKDVRENSPYGPLPRDWARFKGLYRSDDHVVFAYTVGDIPGARIPRARNDRWRQVFSRTSNLTLRPSRSDAGRRRFRRHEGECEGRPIRIHSGSWATDVKDPIPADNRRRRRERRIKIRTEKYDGAVFARIQGAPGARFDSTKTAASSPSCRR